MRGSFLPGVAAVFVFAAFAAAQIPGDASRGAALFHTRRCVLCHSVNGEGGKTAPDLGAPASQPYMPAEMAGLMWHHAPKMWSAIRSAGIEPPKLSRDDVANLFAFLYAARYVGAPGNAGRGERLVSKRCVACHASAKLARAAADPVVLAQRMWMHSRLPRLRSRDLTDILVYVRTLPESRGWAPQFSPASAETGQTLFRAKGCASCHTYLDNRYPARSPVDFAVELWDHPGGKEQRPALDPEEMRRLVGYLWSIQFFDERGSAEEGKRLFVKKQCVLCHGRLGGEAPSLGPTDGKRSAASMIASLSEHGPAMLARFEQRGFRWPAFRDREMADLIAYINSLRALRSRP